MQNGFCHADGSIAQSGHDLTAEREIIPRIAALVQASHDAAVPVFWSRQEHLPGDVARRGHRLATHLEKGGYLVCARGTWDAELVDELEAARGPDDVVFTKHRASCFFETTLGTALRMRGIRTLIVCGVATNYCVESTIRDAYARDYDILAVDDACAAAFSDLHAATMKNVALFHGQVVTTAEVLEHLAERSAASTVVEG